MKRTRIKICGIKTIDDAMAAANLGADAIGLMFYAKSERAIDIETAQSICKALPAFINKVALFVDAEPSLVNEVLKKVEIDTLQFHGQETEQFCQSFNKPYIKALSHHDLSQLDSYPSAMGILLDSYDPQTIGGTGNVFDWDKIPASHRQNIILAGGLDPSNVGHAIKTIAPFALDVSSGVEKIDAEGKRVKGKKDHQLIADFIQASQSADLDFTYDNKNASQ